MRPPFSNDKPQWESFGRWGIIRARIDANNYIVDTGYSIEMAHHAGNVLLTPGTHVRMDWANEANLWYIEEINVLNEGIDLVVEGDPGGIFGQSMGWRVSSGGFSPSFGNPPPIDYLSSQAFSPDGLVLAGVNEGTPDSLVAFVWQPNVGWGSQYASVANMAAGSENDAIAWSPDGKYVAVGMTATPFIEVWSWDNVNGYGTKVSNPATLPPNDVEGIEWSPDGAYIALAHRNSPFISVYPWSNGFGAKIANPATLPTGNASRVRWHPNQTHLIVGHSVSPYFTAYEWNGSSFGAKIANPGTIITGQPLGLDFDDDGSHIAVVESVDADLYIYSFAGSFGAPSVTSFESALFDFGHGLKFSRGGEFLAVKGNYSPFIHVWNWTGSALGPKLADPDDLSTVEGLFPGSVTWGPSPTLVTQAASVASGSQMPIDGGAV